MIYRGDVLLAADRITDKLMSSTQYQIVPSLGPDLTKINNSSWYHEQVIGSECLLICLGDSWTWGDSLGKSRLYKGIDDAEHRLSNIYGHHLSTYLNSDFLNVANPGCSNYTIYKNLNLILPQVTPNYKQIYVVVTLTENCREFYQDKLYQDKIWPIQVDFSKEPPSLASFLENYEKRMFEKFKNSIIDFKNVKMIVGRNFTFSYNDNIPILDDMHTKKTWVEILSEYQNLPGYPSNLRMLSQIGYAPLTQYLKEPNINLFKKFKSEIFDMFFDMTDAIDWLDKSTLNSRYATRHPTELGHKLWADYLLTYFK